MSNLDFKIDYKIEKISNGYLATGNDSTKQKTHYNSIEDFIHANMIEFIQDTERYFKEHDADGEEFDITITTKSLL